MCQMRPTLRSPTLFWLGIGLAVALSGCKARDDSAAPGQTRQIRGDLVPLVRELPLVPMTEPVVVEFDVPPPGRNSSRELMIGLRVTATDEVDSASASDEIRRSGLRATVKLMRLDANSNIAVPLERFETRGFDPSRTVPVGTDGKVPGVWIGDVDDSSMEEAGLSARGSDYRYLAFASAPTTSPGRYQLSLTLDQPSETRHMFVPDLVVAYHRRAK